MSLRDSKRDILTKISSYASYNEIENIKKPIASYASVNNKKDPVGFLIGVLGALVGTEAIKIVVGNLISNFLDEAETVSKTVLKTQFITSISNSELPNDFKTNGINVPLKNIDSSGKFKIDRHTDLGSVMFDNTGSQYNFDNDVYKAILDNGNDIQSGNLILNYNKAGDFLKIKPENADSTIHEFFENTIDKYQILNKKEIVSGALDKIFGTISSEMNKPKNVIIDELKFDAKLEKIINNEDNTDLSDIEINNIEHNATNLKEGLMINDLGCGIETKKITVNKIKDVLDNSLNSDNPIEISNEFDNLIEGAESNRNDDTVENNLITTKDNFFKKLIDFIKLQLIKAITVSPLGKILFLFNNLFNGINGEIKDNYTFLKQNINFIKCIIAKLIASLVEFIYNLIITKLLDLVEPIIKKIIKDRINSYRAIIKSLVKIPFVN